VTASWMDYALQSPSSSTSCPGYCGRVPINDSSPENAYSSCQVCPWGTRANQQSICAQCNTSLEHYDYSFLIFHALVPLFINGLFVKLYSSRHLRSHSTTSSVWTVAQLACCLLESSVAFALSLLLVEPVGSLAVYGCRKGGIQEWYPMFYNSVINYTYTLRCTQEVVYPLYSVPFINLAFCLLNLLVFRSILYCCAFRYGRKLPAGPFYAALWTLPLTALVHSLCSGLIYYAFSHITLLTSLALNAIHLALESRKTVTEMFKRVFTSAEHIAVILVHISLFGFALVAMFFQPFVPNASTITILAVTLPAPTLVYILTVRLTTPIRTVRYRR
jgi:hypothetical protein